MRTPQQVSVRMHAAFGALGLAFLLIFSWIFLKEYLAEWRRTQAAFDELQRRVKDPHALSLAPPLGQIRQVWLPDIDRVDRCTTCHLGADSSQADHSQGLVEHLYTNEAAPVPFAGVEARVRLSDITTQRQN